MQIKEINDQLEGNIWVSLRHMALRCERALKFKVWVANGKFSYANHRKFKEINDQLVTWLWDVREHSNSKFEWRTAHLKSNWVMNELELEQESLSGERTWEWVGQGMTSGWPRTDLVAENRTCLLWICHFACSCGAFVMTWSSATCRVSLTCLRIILITHNV